ncbi:MAG: hypothetical protein E7273_07975 [Pseudobutyrivibrio ruminis]|nr:hypothetical protein [Pseudobutyrivibrio ruminis]
MKIVQIPNVKPQVATVFMLLNKRNIIPLYHGKRQESQVIIPRVCCESCGKTHALIPDYLKPYGSYSICFILAVIYDSSKVKYPIAELCIRYNISVSTLCTWLMLFREHFNAWSSVMEQTTSKMAVASCY